MWRRKLAILVVVGACVLAAAGIRFMRSAARNRTGIHEALVTLSHQAVRGTVRGDLRTAFAGDEETSVEPLAGDRYQVSGWVDVISAEGAAQRHRYSCTIYHDPGGALAAEDVSVVPE